MRKMDNRQILDKVLEGLLSRYRERVPDVNKILKAMEKEKIISSPQDIQNDHIAFRTMGVRLLGINSLAKIFLHYGYQERETYYFSEKKIDARWYAPPSSDLPRVFISELRVSDLSPQSQNIIKSYTEEVTFDPLTGIDLDDSKAVDNYLHTPLWRLPDYKDYQTLLSESEYAAWVIYNRYYLNHYTISVHDLPAGYNTLAQFNNFLEGIGVVLNLAGGKIKVSGDDLLLQSSTVSHQLQSEFAGGESHEIAGSYVEFAERRVLPEYSHLSPENIAPCHRRDGFEVNNADKIFESTYTTQIHRRVQS